MKNDMINRIQSKWGKFTRHQLAAIQEDLGALVGLIQSTYGFTKNQAEREYHDFQLSLRPVLQPIVTKPLNPRR